jgi:hypothetical protein
MAPLTFSAFDLSRSAPPDAMPDLPDLAGTAHQARGVFD